MEMNQAMPGIDGSMMGYSDLECPVDMSGQDGQSTGEKLVEIDFLEIARDADASSTSWFDTNVRRNMQSSLNQFYGRHDSESYYNNPFFRNRSKLFMPKTRSNIRKHEAMCAQAYFNTIDVVSVGAFNDDDPVAKAAADFWKEALNLRLTSSGPRSIDWYQFVLGGYQDAMNYGVSIAFVSWSYKKNRTDLKLIEPENFRFDPACDWMNPVEDSPYLIWKIPMRVGEIKDKIRRGEFEKVSDAQLASARRPETNGISTARNEGRTDPMQRSNSVKEFDIVWVHLNIINQMGEDWAFYTLGTDAYLTIPVPIKEMFLHGRRPFVVGKCVIEAHKNYPSSIPQMTKDMQAYQNVMVNQRIDNVRLAQDKRYLVRKGASVDHESVMRNSPGSLTLVSDVEKDIKVISTPDVNPSAYKEQSLLDIAMDDLVGGFNSGTMQANRSLNETVGGMTLISQSANQVAEYQLKTYNETAVEPTLRLILATEQHYNTDPEFLNLAAGNAALVKKYGSVNFKDIQLKDMLLTVQVGMGAVNPSTKLEKFTMGMTAFANIAPQAQQLGMNIKEIAKEIFGSCGYHDGKRFFNDQVDPQVQTLQQQVQQLQQELAQKRNPVLDAANADLIKAQAFKVRSDATFANIQAAQVIAQMPAIAPVADKISETNGFNDMNGDDPSYEQGLAKQPAGMTDVLQSIGSQDPDALVAAHEQASLYKLRGNTHPLSPISGDSGALTGIEGGKK